MRISGGGTVYKFVSESLLTIDKRLFEKLDYVLKMPAEFFGQEKDFG